jgi:RNA polymerase sigma-70 factor, ECF subfamily
VTVTALHPELVRRAQAADPNALAAIYERYAPGIFRYVYYRLGDPELARDVQSDVFLLMSSLLTRLDTVYSPFM